MYIVLGMNVYLYCIGYECIIILYWVWVYNDIVLGMGVSKYSKYGCSNYIVLGMGLTIVLGTWVYIIYNSHMNI